MTFACSSTDVFLPHHFNLTLLLPTMHNMSSL